jgi:hypothetical protein
MLTAYVTTLRRQTPIVAAALTPAAGLIAPAAAARTPARLSRLRSLLPL